MTALRATVQLPEITDDVLSGLSKTPKSLPPKLFYDAEGSALFDEITRLPEYYLSRTESAIFAEHADEMISAAGKRVNLIELGAGTATKTRVLLKAVLRQQKKASYTPVDISPDALEFACEAIEREFPAISVEPCVADFMAHMPRLQPTSATRLMLYIGSSIGNFEPFASVALLRKMRNALRSGDALLLGTDLRKDPSILVAAYDDAAGVTARFNKNMLARINRELGANFDLERFRHVAEWNDEQSRMEIYLESTCAQKVTIPLLRSEFRFAKGERIHTENSYKYTQAMVLGMLESAKFQLERTWCDERGWYAVHLARAV